MTGAPIALTLDLAPLYEWRPNRKFGKEDLYVASETSPVATTEEVCRLQGEGLAQMNLPPVPLADWDGLGHWALQAFGYAVVVAAVLLLITVVGVVRTALWINLHKRNAEASPEVRKLIRDMSRKDLLKRKSLPGIFRKK